MKLCALAKDFKRKNGKGNAQVKTRLKKADVEKIIETLGLPKPEKVTVNNMASDIFDFVYENCPDKCLLLA